MSRPPGIFRGAELPRLALLAGLSLLGWGLFVTFVGKKRPDPVAQPLAAAVSPLPPADPAPELEAVRDKAKISFRELAAYNLLLGRARAATPASLAAQARRDVLYSQVFERPGRYRGLPIHLRGTARRVLVHDDIGVKLSPGKRLYEAWVWTADSMRNPWVVVFEDAPPSLPVGADIQESIAFDGYFLKHLLYVAGDGTPRFAPLLVGRVDYNPPAGDGGPARYSASWIYVPLIVLFLYTVTRWAFMMRRSLAPKPSPPRFGPPAVDRIEPEALAGWLDRAAEEGDDEGEAWKKAGGG